MSDHLHEQTLPALAGALKMDPAQFQNFLSQNCPDVATGVGALNTALPRFQGLVGGIEGNFGSFQIGIPYSHLPHGDDHPDPVVPCSGRGLGGRRRAQAGFA